MRCESHPRSGVAVLSIKNILERIHENARRVARASHLLLSYIWETFLDTRKHDTADLTGSLDVCEDAPHFLELAKGSL